MYLYLALGRLIMKFKRSINSGQSIKLFNILNRNFNVNNLNLLFNGIISKNVCAAS